jgi:methyl-accepting chemotaxis protein
MRFTIRNKLFGAFGLVLAMLVVLSVVAISKIDSVGHEGEVIGTTVVPSIQDVSTATSAMQETRKNQFLRLATPTVAEQKDAESLLAQSRQAMGQALAHYQRYNVDNETDRQNFTRVMEDWKAYLSGTEPFLGLARKGKDAEAYATLKTGAGLAAWNALKADVKTWDDYNVELAGEALASAKGTESSARKLTIIIALIALLAGAAAAWFIARSITFGVGQALRAAEGVARGDVDQTLEVTSRDELGDMAQAFERMIAYLKDMTAAAESIAAGDLSTEITPVSEADALGKAFKTMIANLREVIGDVSGAAASMSSSSAQMASTSEEAGRAVGEIAHAVSDVAAGAERQVKTVEDARRSTEETAHAADEAHTVANEGVAAAEQASSAMRALRESNGSITGAIRELSAKSEQIGGIVETITGIADQTNLLALNAAIEAARAGEQGKGFAVVAEEVRKLAEESQGAAATIAGLIGEIQQETERTVRVVEEGAARAEESSTTVEAARESFQKIGAAVEHMRSRIDLIVTATNEVASLAEESSASTEQVSASTEETSASAQQIAASAQELAATAERLEQLTQKFRLKA